MVERTFTYILLGPVVAQGYKRASVNAARYGFDPHPRKSQKARL